MFNLMLSVSRYLGSVLRSFIPFMAKDRSIFDVVNVITYSDTLYSSGQPTKKQLECISQAGFSLVINLAPYNFSEHPLKHEEQIVTDLGMRYVHIPVDSSNPGQEDFDAFTLAMQSAPGEKVWVHCSINMRASAFIYKYRCSVLGEEKNDAMWDLRKIWEPFGIWKSFIHDGSLLNQTHSTH